MARNIATDWLYQRVKNTMQRKSNYMKFFSLLTGLIMMTSPYTKAQDASSVKAVDNAVEELKNAMIQADSVKLDKLTFDELSYGHSGGQLQNKQEFIHAFTSHASVFINIDLTNQVISVIDDIAIVRHTLSAQTNDKGKGPGTVKLNILLVWKKNHAGEWRLLARQAVKLQP